MILMKASIHQSEVSIRTGTLPSTSIDTYVSFILTQLSTHTVITFTKGQKTEAGPGEIAWIPYGH